MEWDLNCCIGFDAIDTRRQELFAIIRKLVKKNETQTSESVFSALKAVTQYASSMFPVEEELMRDVFFPGLVEHMEQHFQVKKQVAQFLYAYKDGNVENIDEIVRFLLRWLDTHILGLDLKFGEYRSQMFDKQEQAEREKRISEIRQKPIDKINKLKHLFKEKLINSDDFKDRKVKIFAGYLAERGLIELKGSLSDLDCFQKDDHLSEKEKKLAIMEFLGKVNLEKSLTELEEIESKLLLLNSFFEFEMVKDPLYSELKEKVLSQI
ncbi:MAG: bacteriohemerythrin [Candidatus Rifleibacteriota bacterium]